MKSQILKPVLIALMLALVLLSMPAAQADQGHKGDRCNKHGKCHKGPGYMIGDIGPSGPGSIVYYIDGSGTHGLEARAADEPSSLPWEGANPAAEAYNNPPCPTDATRTTGCWHLPTKTELELLFEQRGAVGSFMLGKYWSSTWMRTGSISADAWIQDFFNGSQGVDPIFNSGIYNMVRAVRAF